ncbi:hypothetical protein D9613_000248 [Agrocybe pediades]|uniref:Uncharacterized protein n=1 Tax=Agrocybe pediades TaxID=84607 RepID=A0A8H4R2W1_9AGAR|nr:hypothetical protein D9613_000248 [Agrocybe pediades]
MVASLCISSIGMAFGALAITLSPILWLIPAVIALTFIYHTYVLLMASAESYTSPRIYSASAIGCGYVLAFLWTAALAASATISSLLFINIITVDDSKVKYYLAVLAGVSLLESLLFGFIAVKSHKELKKIRYRNKWRWRVDITGNSPAQWRLAIKHCSV